MRDTKSCNVDSTDFALNGKCDVVVAVLDVGVNATRTPLSPTVTLPSWHCALNPLFASFSLATANGETGPGLPGISQKTGREERDPRVRESGFQQEYQFRTADLMARPAANPRLTVDGRDGRSVLS